MIGIRKGAEPTECAFCKLDGELTGTIGSFLAGVAYGVYRREIPVCAEHLPPLAKSAKDIGSVWDGEVTH